MSSQPQSDESVTAAESPEQTGELEQALERIRQLEEDILRVRADAENQRRRVLKDAESSRKYAAEKLLLELLPVAESLERGLDMSRADTVSIESLREGKELTLKMLQKTLENNGVAEVNPLGQKFDPAFHQAMSMQPAGDKEPGSVLHVLQKGYMLHDRLLRPALVIVAADS
jgi:molecular chaperone GrpE